jgi:hypothetical protein
LQNTSSPYLRIGQKKRPMVDKAQEFWAELSGIIEDKKAPEA